MSEFRISDREAVNPLVVFKDGREIFKIDKDGHVFWLKDGRLTKAKTDKDLGKALVRAIFGINKLE